MQPSDKFKEVIRVTRLCCSICGADVVDPNYKVNIITYLVIACITVYFAFNAYTVHLKINEGWEILFEIFCTIGSGLQGICKLATAITKASILSSQCKVLTSIYVKFEVEGREYTETLDKCISRVQVVLKGTACISVALLICLTGGPIVIWAFTGRRMLPMQFYIPMVDADTKFGYSVTAVIQYFCAGFSTIGNFSGDMYMMLFFSHCSIFVGILKLKIKELNELTAETGNPDSMKMLLDVLNWHQTYSNYVEETDKLLFWVNFTQITTSGVSIALTLFIIITGDWVGSYSYLCLSFSMMYLYCGMGTLTEVANDEIVDEIYGIHWYNMPVSQQKTVGFMLMKSQSPKKITVGGVLPLSVSTGLQVTKTVYSFFMMLLNYFS